MSGQRRGSQSPVGREDLLRGMGAVAVASTLVAGAVAATAPADVVQGQWQRLMYLHVPAAWLAYLCFGIVLVAGVCHLRWGSVAADRWGRAAAEVGVAATVVTLIVGSVWGRAVWGVWWTWDARLVSTAVMLIIYVAHLALRSLPGPQVLAMRRAAVTGTLGFLVVPVVHFSVVWWTTLHQTATVFGSPTEIPPIDPRMGVALGLSAVAATAIGLTAVVWRLGAHARAGRPQAPLPAPMERAVPTGTR